MKLSDFILLTAEEKNTIVLHNGMLIGKRTDANQFIFLFQLESFYVEVYCSLHSKAIQEYRMFDSTNELQPYLESVSIEGLL